MGTLNGPLVNDSLAQLIVPVHLPSKSSAAAAGVCSRQQVATDVTKRMDTRFMVSPLSSRGLLETRRKCKTRPSINKTIIVGGHAGSASLRPLAVAHPTVPTMPP